MTRGQTMSGPTADTANLTYTTSKYDPQTPVCRSSMANGICINVDDDMESSEILNYAGGTFPFTDMDPPDLMNSGLEHMLSMLSPSIATDLPSNWMDGIDTAGYDFRFDAIAISNRWTNQVTPFGTYDRSSNLPDRSTIAGCVTTPAYSLSDSMVSNSSSLWSDGKGSPVGCLTQKGKSSHGLSSVGPDQTSQSIRSRPYSHEMHPTSGCLRIEKITAAESTRLRLEEVQMAQNIFTSNDLEKPDNITMDLARGSKFQCDYPGCHKAYRRHEHLKRHKQT